MGTWIIAKDSFKLNCQTRKNSRAIGQWRTMQMLTKIIRKESGKFSKYKIQERFTIYTYRHWWMYSKTSATNAQEYTNLMLHAFLSTPVLAWQAHREKKELKLELLTDANKLHMVENGTRVEMNHAIHPYGKTNNMLMRNSGTSKESSYVMYWDVSNVLDRQRSKICPRMF